MASRKWWMPWLWLHTARSPSVCHQATPQLGAIDAWAMNGRLYVARSPITSGRAPGSSWTTGIVSCGPARRKVSRSSSSGKVSRSSQVVELRSASTARTATASSAPTTPRNRVDAALREELDIPDGLADPRVFVLDPCCGTGTYLLEVLERIALTLDEKGGDALTTDDLKRAAMTRVFGFEIMPAPFVIAHLQLGLFLQHAGAPFSEASGERAAVYLTNALTGWEKPHDHAHRLPFPELEDERDAAEKVKRDLPILVILGNPPYNGY